MGRRRRVRLVRRIRVKMDMRRGVRLDRIREVGRIEEEE